KVRAPTLANAAAISHMLEGGYLADAPIVIAAIDPCFSCTDRMVKVARKEKDERFNWEALRNYGIEWYAARGLDLQKVRIGKEGF
nr:NADH dehydrogenase subunit [Clostridia bacterium]